MTQLEEVMYAEETAQIVRKSVHTLANWRSQGKGPKWHRFAGRIVYKRSEVEEWIKAELQAA